MMMTYARARLWLGVTGVGSLVLWATLVLILGLPDNWLSRSSTFGASEFFQLAMIVGTFMFFVAPLDFFGGYWIPKKFGRLSQGFRPWLKTYLFAIVGQAGLFVGLGCLIICSGQAFGFWGGLLTVIVAMIAVFFARDWWLQFRQAKKPSNPKALSDAISLAKSWGIAVPQAIVVNHNDIGFTGGIIGLGKRVKIAIPKSWLSFDTSQLAVVIARRSTAINSGSYSRGLLMAFAWNVIGFAVCAAIVGGQLSSVASFASAVCAFTIWSFVGLLILPTISRNASHSIDSRLRQKQIPAELIQASANSMDQLQDGEPSRSRLVELIFHPLPNVNSRTGSQEVGFGAWNVARTTLFLSWACLGFLSRSVHCNVGRPELWMMLPTD